MNISSSLDIFAKTIILCILLTVSKQLPAQIWDWGQQAEFENEISVGEVFTAVDPLGDVVVVGSTSFPLTFGEIVVPAYRGYMVKYAPDGAVVWAQSLASFSCLSGEIAPRGIRIDDNGNIYTVYNCFGGLSYANFSVTKFDPQGNELMTTTSTGDRAGNAFDLEIGPEGEVFVAGHAYYSSFGGGDSLVFGGIGFPGSNENRPFLYKLSPDGTADWVVVGLSNGSPSSSDMTGDRVTIDQDGNAYLMGVTENDLSFSFSAVADVPNLSNGDIYVVKVAPNGVPLWARTNDEGVGLIQQRPDVHDIEYDPIRETLVLFGKFEDYFLWETTRVPAEGTLFFGNFVLGLDVQGNFKFLNYVQLHGSVPGRGYGGMAIDTGTGDIYVSGSAARSTLDTVIVNEQCNGVRTYVAAFDEEGVGKWIQGVECAEDNYREIKSSDLVTDRQGNIYMAGTVEEAIFALDTLENDLGAPPYLAKLLNKEISVIGKVFRDFNGNGLQDVEDTNIEGIVLEANPLNLASITDGNGIYQFGINTTTHTVRLPALPQHHIIISPLDSTYIINPSTAGELFAGNDYALQSLPDIQDLEVEITPLDRVSPGFSTSFRVRCTNVGSTTQNASLQLIYSDTMAFVDSDVLPVHDLENTTLTWDLGPIAPYQDSVVIANFLVDVTAPLSNTMTTNVQVLPIVGDIEPEDNEITLVQTITGSYDPNDKQALTGPTITPAEVAERSLLDYLIRFQNTGTDTAFTVIVKDTIPLSLDPTTFTMVDASHSYRLSVTEEGVYSWRFDNILLTDSTTNEPASHGFVRFRMASNLSLQLGDTIANRAAIFFDFNEPIITNTSNVVLTDISSTRMPLSEVIALQVFPNPGQDYLSVRIQLEEQGDYDLCLVDLLGREVFRERKTLQKGTNGLEIDARDLPAGIYFLGLNKGGESVIRKWIKY